MRLAKLGYHPSTLDPYLDGVCSVRLPSDLVRLAVEVLDHLDPSAWIVQTAFVEPMQSVTIVGEVEQPGSVPFREGMTFGDLIRDAGSLKPTADLALEVYRVMRAASRDLRVIPEIHSIASNRRISSTTTPNASTPSKIAGFTYFVDRRAAFKLRPYDRVVANTLPRARLFLR